MKHVTIYTKSYCPYCQRAKSLLNSLNIPYEEIDVEHNDTLRQEVIAKYNWQTVPLIVIGDECIGGCDDLHKLHAENKLMEKLTIKKD
ncbi:MAG: glutaredoxin 3 [Candidatus Magasanikbacteria bacterium]|jgi:GrxC family glutaredoxin|nr:glutaredoxin 3 [Candidatus Magasanikbacteria bacterium]